MAPALLRMCQKVSRGQFETGDKSQVRSPESSSCFKPFPTTPLNPQPFCLPVPLSVPWALPGTGEGQPYSVVSAKSGNPWHSRSMENRASRGPGFFPWHVPKNSCQDSSPLGALEWVEGFLQPDSCCPRLEHRVLARGGHSCLLSC